MSRKIDITIRQERVINISVSAFLVLVVVMGILSYAETRSLLGVGIGLGVGILGFVFSFVGLIPFGIGTFLYATFVWNWLLDNTVRAYNLNMPVTLFILSIITVLLSVVWTAITSILIIAWITD